DFIGSRVSAGVVTEVAGPGQSGPENYRRIRGPVRVPVAPVRSGYGTLYPLDVCRCFRVACFAHDLAVLAGGGRAGVRHRARAPVSIARPAVPFLGQREAVAVVKQGIVPRRGYLERLGVCPV